MICGLEEETTHHALLRYPHARHLWDAMKFVWDLPSDEALWNSEPDWLLMLIQQLNDTQRMLLLMVLWRVWHVHNELTHDKPLIPVEASKKFLCGYADHLLMITHYPHADFTKRKVPANLSANTTIVVHTVTHTKPEVKWEPPPGGHVKLNFGGSFVAENGVAGAGMIRRDHEGQVIFVACRWMFDYEGPLEPELAACEEGLCLALHWSQAPL